MIEPPVESASVIRAIASAWIVRRSSAWPGLSGTGNGLISTAPAILRLREARSSSSRRPAYRDGAGSETTDQCRTLASPLSTCAVNTCVPSGRSLGAIAIGTSNSGAKFCRAYSFESLRLMNTDICPVRFGAATVAGTGFEASFARSGTRACSFFTVTLGLISALTLSPGFSLDLGASAFGGSALTSSALASSLVSAAFSSGFRLPVAVASTFAASTLVCTGACASSAFLPSLSDASVSADFASSDFTSVPAASLSPAETTSAMIDGAPSVAAEGFSRGGALPPDGAASDIVTEAFVGGNAPLASAVWVRSRNSVEATGPAMSGFPPSPWPTVDLSSKLASEIAGLIGVSASDALSDFGTDGASTCGSVICCGTTFCAASRGCENLGGVLSAGGTEH